MFRHRGKGWMMMQPRQMQLRQPQWQLLQRRLLVIAVVLQQRQAVTAVTTSATATTATNVAGSDAPTGNSNQDGDEGKDEETPASPTLPGNVTDNSNGTDGGNATAGSSDNVAQADAPAASPTTGDATDDDAGGSAKEGRKKECECILVELCPTCYEYRFVVDRPPRMDFLIRSKSNGRVARSSPLFSTERMLSTA
mmetsp:Transcript_20089/g.41259  ORF Transcript_20089/g.41259 Transcript_20089/m.41259 type:complete len:196 (-) Transcript_20089:1459-2046(-)